MYMYMGNVNEKQKRKGSSGALQTDRGGGHQKGGRKGTPPKNHKAKKETAAPSLDESRVCATCLAAQ
eukprot:4312101-Amphidinium_carterae.1